MKLLRLWRLPIAGIGLASFLLLGCTQERDFTNQVGANNDQTQPASETQTNTRSPDVIYVPTPNKVVDAMLQLADTNSNDVVYDLGSGDGRIPITAAQKYNARGVGIEIDPQRVSEANENAQNSGVSDRVEFRQQDLFESDFSDATVVTLYLLSDLNEKLRPRLLEELAPGTRIVSHAFGMGDWEPEQTQQVDGSTIYLWIVPENPASIQ
ncbi:MAG: SAM-dependent methyltransferase [Pleurocapsa sp.]